jgi:quercetin dioxygenase-like cupin family protein
MMRLKLTARVPSLWVFAVKPLRRLLSLACLASLVLAAPAQPLVNKYSPPTHSNPLGTTFVDWDALAVKTTAVGETRAVFDHPTPTLEKFEMHITTLKPGMQSHAVHQHAWEEMLLVKEGDLEVSINGQLQHAGPGALIFYASHDPHNAKNAGTTPATYYVINFCSDLVHTVADRPAIEQAVPGMFPSSIIDCNSLKTTPTDTGSRVTVMDSPSLTFLTVHSHITTLNVGQSTKPDIVDAGDELFILKAGMLEASVNGVTCRLNEGSFFYCAPNDKRTFRNIGPTPASYQVIKIVSAKTPKAPTK